MRLNIALRALLLFFVLLPMGAKAALEIRITQGVEGAMPIAVVPFGWQGSGTSAPEDIASIVQANLHRSGQFAPLERGRMPQRPTTSGDVNFRAWRDAGVEHVVIGNLQATGQDSYVVEFRLFDAVSGRQSTGHRIPISSSNDLRRAAHMISDIIYQQITGVRGAFSTRVAYVSVTRENDQLRFALQVADADGHRPRTIFRSTQPILSPVWSPDGRRLAYVSFENRRSEVYVQNVDGSGRELIASHEGINSAPAWSPDGRLMALTLSRDGQPDIYILNLSDRSLRKLTDSRSIDTEPEWMPDGRSILFTSDRSGSPQIYEVSANGGQARRLSFEGRYNGNATVSPDGRLIAMVNGEGGRFRIAVLDRSNRLFRLLTDGRLDEAPSFAPNGSMIIYATAGARGQGELAAVSADGRVRQSLVLQEGEVREPAWSPFLD
ncbi:Tol-Pal system beta propeller repeat protein TolB [Thioalkalivibrio denitrificans]|uniref:Tol-Pal system protein TolB n=1 Tax=Thioalkalivibrio denitrificans TaxID=108003 RepID=A0A1V3NL00_9GAMM|nr:Tol-Pal system beta propeller repeat protein TolB [Thioalkalivibrio denitrificans]OOG25623.1 Tol-Pal system beta propeller repeat protein TolB [Thioalkalivibrio denitrificans]